MEDRSKCELVLIKYNKEIDVDKIKPSIGQVTELNYLNVLVSLWFTNTE